MRAGIVRAGMVLTATALVLPAYGGQQRANCDVWTEEVVLPGKSPGWQRNQVLANRNAVRKPPASVARDRDARIVTYKLEGIEVRSSKAKAGSWTRYKPDSVFSITFQKLPCDASQPGR